MTQPTHTIEHDRTEEDELDMESALIADHLAVGYPTTDEPVIECERIDLPEGEVTAIVGPNGSGKSTLLRALSNQLAPESGGVILHGRDIQSLGNKELARELGFLSQENTSPGGITVRQLVAHGRYPHRSFLGQLDEEDQHAIDRALELAGVADLHDASLDQLSGGQKQLAWIAMVLAQETDVLLLDEPTTFLDLYHQFCVLETVRQLNERRGITVGIVLHDVAQAARFADYLVVMSEGEPYEWGPPDRVVTEQLLVDVFNVEATVEYDPELRVLPRCAISSDRE